MAKDKKQPEPANDKQLEAKVDAMMDPKRPDEQSFIDPREESAKSVSGPKEPELPPLNIFSDPKTAPEVPEDLLKDIGKVDETPKEKQAETPEPSAVPEEEPELDDARSDAAIDEIVAKEADTVLANEDASVGSASPAPESPKKLHHHPIFWSFIAVIAVLAITTAFLLANGGNSGFPGSGRVQSWWHSLQKKL